MTATRVGAPAVGESGRAGSGGRGGVGAMGRVASGCWRAIPGGRHGALALALGTAAGAAGVGGGKGDEAAGRRVPRDGGAGSRVEATPGARREPEGGVGDGAGRGRAPRARGDAVVAPWVPAGSPVTGGRVSSHYTAKRWHPIHHGWRSHFALDIAAPLGTPFRATADGVVLRVTRTRGYGLVVDVLHDAPPTADRRPQFLTRYAHAGAIVARRGARVRRGDVLGTVGETGAATGPHLHFEVYRDGASVDPRPSLEHARAAREEGRHGAGA